MTCTVSTRHLSEGRPVRWRKFFLFQRRWLECLGHPRTTDNYQAKPHVRTVPKYTTKFVRTHLSQGPKRTRSLAKSMARSEPLTVIRTTQQLEPDFRVSVRSPKFSRAHLTKGVEHEKQRLPFTHALSRPKPSSIQIACYGVACLKSERSDIEGSEHGGVVSVKESNEPAAEAAIDLTRRT